MILIRNNVERDVPEWDVERFLREGYKPLNHSGGIAPAQLASLANAPDEEMEADIPAEVQDVNGNGKEGIARDTKESAGCPYTEEELRAKTVRELRGVAKELGVWGYSNMDKETMIAVILSH